MLQCHRSKRLKVLQDPRMAFENLQAFRGGFAGWENLQAFCGALRDGKTLKCFESGEVHHSATKAERLKETRRKKKAQASGAFRQVPR